MAPRAAILALLAVPFLGPAAARADHDERAGFLEELTRLPASLDRRAGRLRGTGTSASGLEFVDSARATPHAFEGRQGRVVAIALGTLVGDPSAGEQALLLLADALSDRLAREASRKISARNRATIALVLAHSHHPLAERTLVAWADSDDAPLRAIARDALVAHPPRAHRAPTDARRAPRAAVLELGRFPGARPAEKLEMLRIAVATDDTPSVEALERVLATDPVWGGRLVAALASRTPSLRDFAAEVARRLARAGRPLETSVARLLAGDTARDETPSGPPGAFTRQAERARRMALTRDFSRVVAPRVEAELRRLEGDEKKAFLFGLGESGRRELVPLLLDQAEDENAPEVRVAIVAALRALLGRGSARLADLRDFDAEPACRFLVDRDENDQGAARWLTSTSLGFADPKVAYEFVTSEGRPRTAEVAPDGFVAIFGIPLSPRSMR